VAIPPGVVHAPAFEADPSGRADGKRSLVIYVSHGTGSGPTRLAAFDQALQAAGLANYNLIRLSSVIPPNAVVREISSLDLTAGSHGDVAYCVYADAYASTPGEEAWAGIAWAHHQDDTGAGLFVEQTASSEAMVRRDLASTLQAMSLSRGGHYRLAGQVLSSAVCVDYPVCAVVVATYGTVALSGLIIRRTRYDDHDAA
jgi:arginine decarboxylase